MKKTIYNVAVLMESQEQCDRMKQLCINNGLPIWQDKVAFIYNKDYGNEFYYEDEEGFLYFRILYDSSKTLVTESEFIELLKEHKL